MSPHSCSKLLLLLLVLVSWASLTASAHPVSLSSSVIHIEAKQTRIEVEILVEDLVLHHALKARESRFSYGELIKAAAAHTSFVTKHLLLIVDGKRLQAKSARIKQAGLDLGGVATTDVKKRKVVYELKYATFNQPRFLTIDHSLGGEKALVPALMDCMVLHLGGIVEVSEQITAGHPHTVELDWKNPPAKERSWRELRAQRRKQTAERLGIASYSGIYSFLYIDRYEVRHEVLVPLLTLMEWIDLQHSDPTSITPAEQRAAAKQITAQLKKCGDVEINAKKQQPVVDRIQFFGLDVRDFALNAPARTVNLYQARVGVILRYPTLTLPKTVTLNWNQYSDRATYLRTRILPFQDTPADVTLNRERTRAKWQLSAPDKLIEVKLQPIQGDKSNHRSIVGAMLKGLYAAQKATTDEAIYDRLLILVRPQLARPIFLQMNRTLTIAEQGGAKAKIRKVQLKDFKLSHGRQHVIEGVARWEVEGTVEHWGHIHMRRHLHAARLRMEREQEHWTLVEFETQLFKQLSSQLSVR